MDKWEYRYMILEKHNDHDLDDADKLGNDGWECYAVTKDGANYCYHMKRKIQ